MAFACAAALAAPGSASAARGGSPYPSGATRPAFTVSRAALRRASARAAANSAHGRSKPHALLLHGDAARALAAFQAMQKRYYVLGRGLYAGEPFSFLWPFSQALAATVTLANVPALRTTMLRELHARLVGLRNYLDTDNSGAREGLYASTLPAFDGTVAPPAGPGGAKYYDDNDWVGIELMRVYELTHEASALGSAEGVMAFEMAGWQGRPELGCPGGLPFSNEAKNADRNTITTAPAAELALQLYSAIRQPQYLAFAIQAYEWVRACLLEPNGLYADHLNRRGTVEPHLWSYTQGAMIGAGTLLYEATGNGAFLYQARQTAKAALAYFTPAQLGGEIPFFASVYFRNLLYLDSVTHDPPGPRLAQAYVDYAWQNLRLPGNVFVSGSPPSGQLLVQAAIVQIYGLLSTPARTYF